MKHEFQTPSGHDEHQKAGVVAYRSGSSGEREILLVTARRDHQSWIFPVGTIDPGETAAEAAARECAEESGYAVTVLSLLTTLELSEGPNTNHFAFFLATTTGETRSYEIDRDRRWIPLSEIMGTIAVPFHPVARAVTDYFLR